MANTSLNLQRNSEVYVSTVDLTNGGAAADMTNVNTWRVEVLAGYAVSQAAATQDITSSESGLSPDRSTQRFNTTMNPTEWSFQTYLRPTAALNTGVVAYSGNAMPLADWFLWQGLMSNTAFASGVGVASVLQSAFQNVGQFALSERAAAANVRAHTANFASAAQYQLYLKMDNVYYQVQNATVNEGAIDAAIDGIAMTSWSGFGTDFVELIGAPLTALKSVIDSPANGYANVTPMAGKYHKWAVANNATAEVTANFIKNRLSTISVSHTVAGAPGANTYTFPVTGLGFTYNNALTYLTPEELSVLNVPIGQFTGSRTITGNFTAYLRTGDANSAQFLRNLVNDGRTSVAQAANANLQIGGTSSPFVAIQMPAVQFNLPTHAIEDVIGISVEFLAQEPTASRGTGSEMTMIVG